MDGRKKILRDNFSEESETISGLENCVTSTASSNTYPEHQVHQNDEEFDN